jgi:hypothetical protein
MSQKHPHRDRDHASSQRRKKAAELKRARKERRLELRTSREKK